MPLIQFVGSLIAVALVAWIASRLFHNPTKLTVDRVVRNTARYCPHIDLTTSSPSVFISEPGDTAVFLFPNRLDGIALLTALGDRVVVREITDCRRISVVRTNAGLLLDIGDFTQPKIKMLLPDNECQSLLEALESRSPDQTEPAHA